MKQIQPAQGGGGGGSMFSKYSGEQINQIPEGYVQAMGQSPIAALISSGLQGYQMGTQMQMAQTKMGLEERSVKASETSATAAAAKATSEEGKLALLTEGKAIEGQAALDAVRGAANKLAFDYIQQAVTGFSEEQGSLQSKLGLIEGTDDYKKGVKSALELAAVNKRRQITVATRLSELNDKLALGAENQTPRESYRFPTGISLPPNDPISKKYRASSEDLLKQHDAWNKYTDWDRPMVMVKPNTPLQQSEAFKRSLNADELRRMNQYSNPFGNR